MARIGALLRQSYNASTTSSYIERLCTSWILPPLVLFAYRVVISAYAFAVIFGSIGWEASHGRKAEARQTFSYFTHLTYWGIAFYFAFAAAHTASHALRGRAFLETWPKTLKWLHSAFYMTVTVYPFIVTAVFWGLLSLGAFRTRFDAWDNLSEHALNSVFGFLEIMLPRSEPHPWLLIVPLILILALYLALAYLTHAVDHYYVYYFLNIQKNGSGYVAGVIIGILVGSIVVFVLVRYLIWLRLWITEKKLHFNGKLSSRATQRDPESLEEKEIAQEHVSASEK